jgi:hypothetical protein
MLRIGPRGSVLGDVDARASATVRVGGPVGGVLDVRGGAMIRVEGTDFEVDGSPVEEGSVLPVSGRIQFTSLSVRETVEIDFVRFSAGAVVLDSVGRVLLNNGGSPPMAENVIDLRHTYPLDAVAVQNVGCDAKVADPCVEPGAPMEVRMESGEIASLTVSESSSFWMEGGRISGNVTVQDEATAVVIGPIPLGKATVEGDATLTLRDVEVIGASARDRGTLIIEGENIIQNTTADDDATVILRGALSHNLIGRNSSTLLLESGSAAEVSLSDDAVAEAWTSRWTSRRTSRWTSRWVRHVRFDRERRGGSPRGRKRVSVVARAKRPQVRRQRAIRCWAPGRP